MGAAGGGFAGTYGSGRAAPGVHASIAGAHDPSSGAEATCRAQLPTAAELAPGAREHRIHGPGQSVGVWRTVLASTRAGNTIIVFEAAGARATEVCFAGREPGGGSLAGSYGTRPFPSLAAGAVSIASSGGVKTRPREGSELYSWIVGRTGRGVRGVVVTFADGTHLQTSAVRGWFLAWWRGRRPLATTDAIAATVTTPGSS